MGLKGKTPILAALAIVEFIGPCRFSHFDEKGMPVAKTVPLPLVQIAATSIDQCGQTLDMLRGMLAESPAEAEYGLDIGKHLIQFNDGRPGKIVPVTASSRGLEGGRPTFVIMDETHHWIDSNQGVYVFETLDRNAHKPGNPGSRWVQTTNAYNPLENSVAQRIHEALLAGSQRYLYDCIEAQADIDLSDAEAVAQGLRDTYGDSWWADIEGLVETVQSPLTPPGVAYRFYLNNIQENADGWMSKAAWEACLDESDPVRPGEQIAVGFDGSIRGDSTGLVGARLRDGKLFLLGLWERPEHVKSDDDWEVDVLSVEAAVKRAFETYKVEWMYCDPPYWQDAIGRWAIEYGDDIVFEYWTNKPTRMVNATERMHSAVMVGDLKHDGDPKITQHVLNCVTREVPQGLLVCKNTPRSKRKIDLAVCSILAYEARADAIADGRLNRRRGRVVGF